MSTLGFSTTIWATRAEDVIDSSKAVAGLLDFDEDHGFELTIPWGILLDDPSDANGGRISSIGGLSADAVYGFSQKGHYLVLRDVITSGHSATYPGFEKQVLSGSSLLASRQPIEANPKVTVANVEIPGLKEWIGHVPFEVVSTCEGNAFNKLSFTFESENMQSIPLMENEEVRISVGCKGTKAGGRLPSFSFEFSADRFLRIETVSSPLSLDEMLDRWINPVVNFLSFCMGFKYAATSIEFVTTEKHKASFYARLAGAKGLPSDTLLRTMPFPYPAIEDQIAGMLESWMQFGPDARNGSKLLISLMDSGNMPIEMIFLASAQALEAMSRDGVDEKEMSNAQHQERLDAIKNSNLPSRVRDWALLKLKYANMKSANQLADDLLKTIDPVATYLVPDLSKFKEDHREHRNAFTHRREVKAGKELSSGQLYWHAQAVQLLVYGYTAVKLGMSPDGVLTLLKKTGFRSVVTYHPRELCSKQQQHPPRAFATTRSGNQLATLRPAGCKFPTLQHHGQAYEFHLPKASICMVVQNAFCPIEKNTHYQLAQRSFSTISCG